MRLEKLYQEKKYPRARVPTGTEIILTIGYDIKHSNKHALDYLTHYNRLGGTDHTTTFGHVVEAIDPLLGVTGVSSTLSTYAIPAPDSTSSPVAGQPTTSFNALPSDERVMTLFGGTISNVAYAVQGDLTADKAETRVTITFTVDSSTATRAVDGFVVDYCQGLKKKDFTSKAEDVSRSRRGRREYLGDGKTREFMALLDDFFNSLVDIPRLKHGNRQSIGSLINEETLVLGNYLRKEEKMWIPRIPIL